MTTWYYSGNDRQRHGPLSTDEMAERHREGRLDADTLVWREGLTEWRPWPELIGEVVPEAAAAAPPAAPASPLAPQATDPAHPAETFDTPADTSAYPASAASAAGSDDAPTFASGSTGSASSDDRYAPAATASAAPLAARAATVAEGSTPTADSPYAPPRARLAAAAVTPEGDVVDAGFWKRVAALFIDSLIVGIAYYAILIAVGLALGFGPTGAFQSLALGKAPNASLMILLALIYVLYPLISGLYYIGFESSASQATLGKMAIGIKVTNRDGGRMSRANALGRWCSHLLNYFTLYIGYLMAAFTDRKRGLHDLVAGTYVVDRWAHTDRPELQRRELGVVAIIVLVLAGLLTLGYLAIMVMTLFTLAGTR